MTGGIGFVSTGKSNNRRNLGFLKHTSKVKSKNAGAHEGSDTKLKFKQGTKKEVAQFMEKFELKRKKELRLKIILGTIITLIVTSLLYLILW